PNCPQPRGAGLGLPLAGQQEQLKDGSGGPAERIASGPKALDLVMAEVTLARLLDPLLWDAVGRVDRDPLNLLLEGPLIHVAQDADQMVGLGASVAPATQQVVFELEDIGLGD